MLDSRLSAQATFHYYDETGNQAGKIPTVICFQQTELPAIYWSNVHRCIYTQLAEACKLRFEDVPCITDYYGPPGHCLTVYLCDDTERARRMEEIASEMHEFVVTDCYPHRVPTLRTYAHKHLEDRSDLTRAVAEYTQKYGSQELLLLLDQFPDVFQSGSILTARYQMCCD